MGKMKSFVTVLTTVLVLGKRMLCLRAHTYTDWQKRPGSAFPGAKETHEEGLLR